MVCPKNGRGSARARSPIAAYSPSARTRSRRDDGKGGTFYVIENPDWVNIIALTKQREVVLIRQFRHGSEDVILEIPGGMIDGNESAENAARRELLEETGYSSERWFLLGKSEPNPAIQNNSVFHYLAIECEASSDVYFDEHESIVTETISLDMIQRVIAEGKISHSLVVAAFYYLHSWQKSNENISI